MTNKASSFPAAPPVGPLHRHGGRITALGELPIHALGNDYTVDGNGTVLSLPSLSSGITVFLSITGAPTFKNSAKLVCPNGVDFAASAGNLVIARSDGNGAWRIYPVGAGGVSSIAGNTGAFTLGDGLINSANVLTADFTDYLGFISGLTLSTPGAGGTFAIAPGVAVDIAGGGILKITSGTFTKTYFAWAAGSGNGSFDGAGAAPSATTGWYHVFVIKRTDTGAVDVLISLSATAPTLPSPYTLFRRIGAMKTDGSFHLIAFTQNGNEFLWTTPVNDINTAVLGTTATLFTVTTPPSVKTNVLLSGFVNHAAVNQILVSSPDVADTSPLSGSNFQVPSAGGYGTSSVSIRTNTSQQVRARSGAASTTLNLYTFGYVENL
ncbi:hypothetical protein SAMN05444159_1248 [Bradyrhizobium lablabi]|uniref:Uncharacterized protein n=1 Tax=Bradyrhizobium lablabi TaxID=722472 RepID=A0A1M6LDM0_9BRAD|nr:hypothetical protein [Bradyrhizobium lablabi]SHJ69300.1 hypothetical protein SAMN05444159_1248 [Bradyrhizobium lablabi]